MHSKLNDKHAAAVAVHEQDSLLYIPGFTVQNLWLGRYASRFMDGLGKDGWLLAEFRRLSAAVAAYVTAQNEIFRINAIPISLYIRYDTTLGQNEWCALKFQVGA